MRRCGQAANNTVIASPEGAWQSFLAECRISLRLTAYRPGIARISGRCSGRNRRCLVLSFSIGEKESTKEKAATAWGLRLCHHKGIARGLRSVILTVLGRIPFRSTSCLAHLCAVAGILCLEVIAHRNEFADAGAKTFSRLRAGGGSCAPEAR